MHMRKLLCLSVMLALMSLQAFAQRTVTGRVTDDKNNPLANVTVQVKNTNTGTVTKEDGSYSLTVPSNARALVFSFTDMASQEVALGSGNVVNAALTSNNKSLDEVIVVGYGT